MEILKTATEWAKAEVFSSRFFVLFGIMFLLAAVGFWYLGKTEVARAYIIPLLVSGSLLLAIGFGIFFTNSSRVKSFETDYHIDSKAFVKSKITRTEKSIGEYKTIVFKIIPFIVVAMALLLVFVDKPIWRAISITTIAMMIAILFVDSNAKARIEIYHEQLVSENSQNSK